MFHLASDFSLALHFLYLYHGPPAKTNGSVCLLLLYCSKDKCASCYLTTLQLDPLLLFILSSVLYAADSQYFSYLLPTCSSVTSSIYRLTLTSPSLGEKLGCISYNLMILLLLVFYLSPDLCHDADKNLTKMFFSFSFQCSFEKCT